MGTLIQFHKTVPSPRVLSRHLLWRIMADGKRSVISVPLLGIGYGIVSGGHALSADLILAVFQTNPGEALSYLKEQPLFFSGHFPYLESFAISILVISLFEENAESRTGSKAIHHFDSNGFYSL